MCFKISSALCADAIKLCTFMILQYMAKETNDNLNFQRILTSRLYTYRVDFISNCYKTHKDLKLLRAVIKQKHPSLEKIYF